MASSVATLLSTANLYSSNKNKRMNLKFWKHKQKKEVISHDCFSKLPEPQKSYYSQTSERPTHRIDSVDTDRNGDSSIISTMLTIAAIDSMMSSSDSSPSYDSSSSDSGSSGGSDFGGFSGGDGGGGGASGNF